MLGGHSCSEDSVMKWYDSVRHGNICGKDVGVENRKRQINSNNVIV